MPLDQLAKRFLDMTAAASAGQNPVASVADRRAALVKLMALTRADALSPEGEDGVLPGPDGNIPYRIYAPEPCADVTPGFIFFHGGGMVAGSIATHDVVCRALAQEGGCRVVSVGYRLAPEHPFPAAIDDARAATAWVSANAPVLGIDPKKLVVGGDSAGATLAVLVCQGALQTGLSIALQCLICPVLDFGMESDSRREFANGYLIEKQVLESDLRCYLPDGVDRADPRVSPLRAANPRGQPRAIIHTAEYDPLRDEGDAYAARLRQEGVRVEHVRHDGMVHNFHTMGAILPQGRAVLKQIGAQIRAALA